MRPTAGDRPVLVSTAEDEDRIDRDHVASLRQGRRTLARLWWQCAGDEDLMGWIAAEVGDGETAVLEHRRGPVTGVDWGVSEWDLDQPADVLMRLSTIDSDRVLARAIGRRVDQGERWTLLLDEGYRWEFDVPLRRRPKRLELRDPTGAGSATLQVCRRPSGWVLDGPPGLGAASTTMCLWLAHLLETAHILHDRPWSAPTDWTLLVDDTGRLARGGFTAVAAGGGGMG